MGFKVILTSPAIEDLRVIAEYIAADNPKRALSFGDELLDRALNLGELPGVGRMVPEIGDSAIREVIHESYRIIYKVYSNSNALYVLRFWHAARGQPG